MIIDIFNEVYSKLKTELSDVTVLPSYPTGDVTFPIVTIQELSNVADTFTRDTSGNFTSSVTYEVNIFSNKTNSNSESREIRNKIELILGKGYGMGRNYSNETPNFLDSNIYRYTMRYSFTIDNNKKIYRR